MTTIKNKLESLYNKHLQRKLDNSGFKTYSKLILQGRTIDYVEKCILESDEYIKKNDLKNNLEATCCFSVDKYCEIQLASNVQHVLEDMFTVLITNWKRPDYLWKCFLSVVRNNIKNIVISTCEESDEHIEIFESISKQFPNVKIVSITKDYGCNKMWMTGLYQVKTDYVLVLHDDDELSPLFKNFTSQIKDCLASRTPLVLWDGKIKENGIVTHEYHCNMPDNHPLVPKTGTYNCKDFHNHYKNGIYPISPVVQIMQTSVCIEALNECETHFIDKRHYTKSTMMIGNEIMMTMRNLESGFSEEKHILYIHEALTYYGRHPESESEIYVKNGSDKLKNAYIFSRNYINNVRNPNYKPNILHITNTYCPQNKNDKRRHILAYQTWRNLYNKNHLIPIHLHDNEFDRNSSHVGDKRKMPFIKDIINIALKNATNNDICIITNADICICDDFKVKLEDYFDRTKNECGFCFRYDKHSELSSDILNSNDIQSLQWYVGSDLFAFKISWWKKWANHFPDFIIGKPCWDWIMRNLMGYSVVGTSTFTQNLECQGNVCDMGSLIYHEKHESYAELPENYFTDKANLWNWVLAKRWFEKYAENIKVDGSDIFKNLHITSHVSNWIEN